MALLILDSHKGTPPLPTEIVDLAFNPLAASSLGQMLGFTESPTPEEALTLRIYLFFIETIRIEDTNNGNLFLKRFLEGPQEVWDRNQAKIFALKDLWSVTDIPDDLLKFMKNIVGWTKSLESITDALDFDTLRRLIGSAVALWKIRGTEDAMISILTLVLGARIRSWNWFEFRFISGETGFGNEADGFDPHNISITNDREFNVRIMDDGTVDRTLVFNLVNLFRPTGERVTINYLRLIDLFRVDGDDAQWAAQGVTSGNLGTDVLVVSGGAGLMDDDTEIEEMHATPPGAVGLTQYEHSARIRGETPHGVNFHRQGDDDWYSFQLVDSAGFELIKREAGVDTTIASAPKPVGMIVDASVFYMFRVVVTVEGAAQRIVCFVDGFEVFNLTDTTFTSGDVGILHGVTGTVEVDEVEVLGLPAETDFVDINS